MKSMMRKTTVREIRQSFGRFFAMFAIIALGVGFFAGLKVTKQAMLYTGDSYLAEKQLFDFRLLSTIGFEPNDVDFFQNAEGVQTAAGAYSADVLYINPAGNEGVLKVHSLTKGVNGLELKAGRLPERAGECVVDSNLFTPDQIGTKIRFSDTNKEETLQLFAYQEYEITGIADSSYYINFERGNTSLGTGKVSGFIYLQPEGFSSDYFTEVFIKLDSSYPIYSDSYQDFISGKQTYWEDLCKNQVLSRYHSIVSEAEQKLKDAGKELDSQKETAVKELERARNQLEEAEREIADGEKQLADAKQSIADGNVELDKKEGEIAQAETRLSKEKKEFQKQEKEFLEFEASVKLLEQSEQFELLKQQLEESRTQLEEGRSKLLTAESQIKSAKAQIAEGREQLQNSERELLQKQAELEQAKQETADGRKEYEENLKAFEEETAEAEKEIQKGRKELEELTPPETYVLDRTTNIGYVCFENDSDIVEGIADVFPIFFFLVAALVCVTTMNRMVEEQRAQIGVLKALGYSRQTIMGKYIFYSGSAAVLGCIFGFIGGTVIFPNVIWQAYHIMYNMPGLKYVFNLPLALISLVVSMLCSVGATWFSCRYELKEVAAELLRPKSPKAGKRILLERITFIWKHLKFLHKVTMRNIFRYKKRFFMMVFGISGCTALLVTGLGIKDSIADVATQQFEKIQIYDGTVGFQEPQTPGEKTAFTDAAENYTKEYTLTMEKNITLISEGNEKDVSLVILENPELADRFLNLHQAADDAPVGYPESGTCIISNNLADSFHISEGDILRLRDESLREIEVTVSGIFENFVYHYIYLGADTYREQLQEEPEYKTAFVNFAEGQEVHQAATEFMKLSGISSVTVNADMKERIGSMMDSLNYIVLLVIACAAFLAFIVLYNLTNINITERIREIATIKVLGFYKNETASYVFRENVVLTGIGGIAGLVLGKYLHAFVMAQIDIDLVSFDVHITRLSYLFSIILTFVFAWGIHKVMARKLNKISMAESLKSVD